MIVEKAFAKINIGLNIVNKRDDGYHNIDTIMQTINLHDVVKLTKAENGIRIFCDNPLIPVNKNNTAFKAADLFSSKMSGSFKGVDIHIEKNIPTEAGLGGGSSDAAAVLRALNKLFCTGYGTTELIELASEIGSDVPFLVEGGTMRITGRGEIMEKLTEFNGVDIVIVMPREKVSTKSAYSLFSKIKNPHHPDIEALTSTMDSSDPGAMSRYLGNTFEALVFPYKPLIEQVKHDIIGTHPLACSMTGSGSAVYGIYDSEKSAGKAFSVLSNKHKTFITKTTGGIF